MPLSYTSAVLIGALVATAGAFPAFAHDIRALGDDHLSSTPQRGYLMSCSRGNPNAPSAQVQGPWIDGNRVDMDAKISVQGSVDWPSARLSIREEGTTRRIESNGLPTHETGIFPIQRSDPAYAYDRNPNEIRAQRIALSLPLNPSVQSHPSCVPMGVIGYTLTNVALFNAVDARGRDAAAHEVQDRCHGHPERRGVYHYHDLSPCLADNRDANGHSALMGYAIDGFGIYGPYETAGSAQVTNAQLDECHGHVGSVLEDEAYVTRYHYHLNSEFPYSVGCFRGAVARTR